MDIYMVISMILFWGAVFMYLDYQGNAECPKPTAYEKAIHVMKNGRECVIFYDEDEPIVSKVKCE